MKKFLALVILCITSAANGIPRNPRIIGALSITNKKFPYLVALFDKTRYKCGGSIINKRWILTAAHCLHKIKNATDIKVYAGIHNLKDENAQIYEGEYFTYHKDFIEHPGHYNDIGLIRVNRDIKYNANIQPIKLPTERFEKYGIATKFAGWGATKTIYKSDGNASHPHTNNLKMIELTIIDSDKCSQKWKKVSKHGVLDSQICTFNKINQGTCLGDSGSPLVVDGIQIGIDSFLKQKKNSCAAGVPDVFMRVHNYIDWIENEIKNYSHT